MGGESAGSVDEDESQWGCHVIHHGTRFVRKAISLCEITKHTIKHTIKRTTKT